MKKQIKVEFNLKPYDLQQEVIDYMDGRLLNKFGEKYRFFALAIGRQAGKSWLVKKILLERAINRNQTCMIVAPAISSARRHWNDLVNLIENSGMPYKKMNVSSKEIQFYGGGSIIIRSAIEPDNIRGDTLDFLALDEAAFFRNGAYVWYSVCLPMVTASRGDVLFTSTPNGRNWFYEVFQQGQNPDNGYYKSWRASSYVSPFQDHALLDQLKTTMPEYQWLEEFMAEFLADGSGVFAGAEKAAVLEVLRVPQRGHDYVAGIDFGFNSDPSTFTVIDKWTREQAYGEAFYNYGTAATMGKLVKLLNHWQPQITHLEKNGMGNPMFDILRMALSGESPDIDAIIAEGAADDGAFTEDNETFRMMTTAWNGKIKAIHVDNKQKREMVEKLAAGIEYGRLKTLSPVPGTYGEKQLNEMSTYQRKRTISGLEVTYAAAEGSNDDTISGLYLAYKGLPKPAVPEFLRPKLEKTENKKSPFRGSGTLRKHRKGRKNAQRD